LKEAQVLNSDLWSEIDTLLSLHQVKVAWVKAHSDNELNNEADKVASAASKEEDNFIIDYFYEKNSI
jgi:ribonuclease HI